MKHGRATGPRRVGLLTAVGRAPQSAGRQRFPYGIGDRIDGDLTVIGHLAVGRIGHLYQVWSASEWCTLTCKILSPDLRGERRAEAALRREARILRVLDHPNVVRGYGAGEHDGLPYHLMEYLEGPSLFDLLEHRPERRFGPDDAARAALHVTAGLYHLHRRGWLHLDLKPANLLLRDQVPVLVDFDAARRIAPGTRPGSPLGTAPYMAPEQVRRERLGAAADIYGLGALLYELLTGRWPFEAVYLGEQVRTGKERLHPQIGSVPPESPRMYNPAIPRSLAGIVLRCIDPDPERRFPSMHALLGVLAAELDDPVALWPTGVQVERRSSPRATPPRQERIPRPVQNSERTQPPSTGIDVPVI